MYRWGLSICNNFSLGLNTTVFQAGYVIKACIVKDIVKGYTDRNICFLSKSQVALKGLESFQTNSKLFWDDRQSLMKLTEHKRIKLMWVIKAFLKIPLPKAGELFDLSRNQLSILRVLLTGHCHFKGHPFKLRLVNSPKCEIQVGIWNSLPHSLWLWGFGHIKTQAPGSSFYKTRWLWRHLCQQETALCSRCDPAKWKG